MGVYADHVLPRIVDGALRGREIEELRARVSAGVACEVLEIGFGSGRNIPYYPAATTRVRAVDPAVTGRKLAAKRLAGSAVPVEFIGLDGAELPIGDGSIDHVLVTWTLCTIPDVSSALGEIRRVLRPGGALHFVEHGKAPDAGVARWQNRLNPLQNRLCGGCNLNRMIDELILGSGLEMTRLDRYFLRGPKFFSYMYEGVATKSGSPSDSGQPG